MFSHGKRGQLEYSGQLRNELTKHLSLFLPLLGTSSLSTLNNKHQSSVKTIGLFASVFVKHLRAWECGNMKPRLLKALR